MTRTRNTRTTTLLIGGPLIALLLAGCGNDGMSADHNKGGTASSTSSYGPAAMGPHNDADIAFATDMIPHHAQAIEMATMALEQATNAQVKTLATAIQGAQDPEIRTMSGWLAGWDKPVPSTSGSAHSTGSGHTGTGMMSADQMAELAKAEGAAFDRLWVEMMTEHHQGAIEMAKTELADGENTEAKQLAQTIIDAQSKEITTMAELLKTLPKA